MQDSRYIPVLHHLALLTAVATFPLIFMGGLVTSHGAGMSVPDWPNSYGYNMFLFPPRLWVGGILYEHTHRLAGTVVGLLSIALCIVAWKLESRRWARWLATSVLLTVILQGILGGLRVVLVQLAIAPIHACFAQAFFGLTAVMAAVTSRWWVERALPIATSASFRLAVIAAIAIYLQLIAGAVMRHYNAGLAIPDLPLAYGRVLPPTDADELAAINNWRAFQQDFEPVTLSQVWLHFSHRIGAVIVTIAVTTLVICALRRYRGQPLIARPAILLAVVLVVQLTLGILTVVLKKPADLASAHVAVGALTLFTTVALSARFLRSVPSELPVSEPVALMPEALPA